MRGLKYFYLTTLFIGLLILSAFLITLVTGLDLIPIWVFERYEGSEMMRLSIYNYGIFYILFPLSFILFLFSRRIKSNIKYRNLVYIAGIFMIFTLLITLSRANFISTPGTILTIIILNSYIFRKSKVFALTKILIPVAISLLIINFILPKYVDYIVNISQDTFLLLTEGKDTRGEKEYRVSGTDDLEVTKKYIKDNFLLGTGYTYLYWAGEYEYASCSRGVVYAMAMDAANEVPIYYIFFGYGLAGFIIMIFLYSYLIRLFLRLLSLLRKNTHLLLNYPYELLFVFLFLYMIAGKFTYSFYALGRDFTNPLIGIFIGMGFALLKKLENISSGSDVISNNKNYTDQFSVRELSIK
jgi:hypothetical protein